MSSQRRYRDLVPKHPLERFASCRHCRCLVLAFRWEDGRISIWDPGVIARRFIQSTIGAGEWLRSIDQPWGMCYGLPHYCVPADLRRVRTAKQNRPEVMP